MRRLGFGIVFALLAMVVVTTGVVFAQAKPEFKLGFKVLADQIPDVVGQPLENEHWGDNGDSLQQTTSGLMVWRKADNWTAFTNGARTWINGPARVQSRSNNERFAWESEISPSPTDPATIVFGSDLTEQNADTTVVGERNSFGALEPIAYLFRVTMPHNTTEVDVSWTWLRPDGMEDPLIKATVPVSDSSRKTFSARWRLPNTGAGTYRLRILKEQTVLAFGEIQIQASTPAVLAEAYIRALFAHDSAVMQRFFPASRPDEDRDEYHLELVKLTVAPLTGEEAGDRNPVTRLQYARGIAEVMAAGKKGTYTFVVGTTINQGHRIITQVSRSYSWP